MRRVLPRWRRRPRSRSAGRGQIRRDLLSPARMCVRMRVRVEGGGHRKVTRGQEPGHRRRAVVVSSDLVRHSFCAGFLSDKRRLGSVRRMSSWSNFVFEKLYTSLKTITVKLVTMAACFISGSSRFL